MVIDHRAENFFYRVNKQARIVCIYLVTSPSGKQYIGQTSHLVLRIYKYSLMKIQQEKLLASFKKYGWESHAFEIVKECSIEELNDLEVYYMKLFDTFDTEHGMNLRSGGNHYTVSRETREKLRKANLGKRYSAEVNYKKGNATRGKKLPAETIQRMLDYQRNRPESHVENHRKAGRCGERNHMFGKKWTDEQKELHSRKMSGKNNPFFGKPRSEETRIKISEANTNPSEETRLKMRLAKIGKPLSQEHKDKIMATRIKLGLVKPKTVQQ